MTKRNLEELLKDILEAIDDIETFTKTVTLEQFSSNKEKILAVIKSIEIIGEAVKLIQKLDIKAIPATQQIPSVQ